MMSPSSALALGALLVLQAHAALDASGNSSAASLRGSAVSGESAGMEAAATQAVGTGTSSADAAAGRAECVRSYCWNGAVWCDGAAGAPFKKETCVNHYLCTEALQGEKVARCEFCLRSWCSGGLVSCDNINAKVFTPTTCPRKLVYDRWEPAGLAPNGCQCRCPNSASYC